MRMWMVNPKLMCDRHLLGEHVELHMLLGALKKGRSIQGFLDKGLLEPQNAYARHDELVREMEKRGMNHKSPLPNIPPHLPYATVNIAKSLAELINRCEDCSFKSKQYLYNEVLYVPPNV